MTFVFLQIGIASIGMSMLNLQWDITQNATLQTDEIKVRDPYRMPPLLLKLSEKRPDRLHYMGVSFGLTQQLHKFWKRAGFVPLYMRQTPNDLTGEYTCVMLRTLRSEGLTTQASADWLDAFARGMLKEEFVEILSYHYKWFMGFSI